MSPDSLFDAILRDDDLRADSLRQTLALARRRRRIRTVRGAIISVACVAGMLGVLAMRFGAPVPTERPAIPITPALTATRSYPKVELRQIRTQTNLFIPIRTAAHAFTPAEAQPGVAVIETRTATPPVELLSDRQLLAALPNRRSMLVGQGTAEARLVQY
jgi:hypothetical protein